MTAQDNWPFDDEEAYEFRRWAKEKYGIRGPKDVTTEIIDDWRADRLACEQAEAAWAAEEEREFVEERRLKQARVAALHNINTDSQPIHSLAASLLLNSGMQENHDAKRRQLLLTWRKQFDGLSDLVKTAWKACYRNADEKTLSDLDVDALYIVPCKSPLVTPDNADAIATGTRDSEFIEFRRFTAGVQLALNMNTAELHNLLHPAADSRPAFKAWSRSEIIKRAPEPWLIPGIVQRFPVIYGPPKECKSLWVQKLSVCLALGVPFDGIEVPQGRVLYVTRDMGAGARDVQERCDDIAERMGFDPALLEGALLIVDGRFYLNEPASVAALLAANPGQYVAVVIDTLIRCVNGSLVQDSVASAALDGVEAIQDETGGAVIAVHHSPRGAMHLFGSVVLDAALDAQLSVQRDGDIVTVKVERVKNDALPKRTTYVYRREGALLVRAGKQPNLVTAEPVRSAAQDRHSAILALVPDTWTREETARTMVEHLLGSDSVKPATKRQRWHRALQALERDGLIIRRDGMVQRRSRNSMTE